MKPHLVLAAFALGWTLTGTASAGPNAGGTLLLHYDAELLSTHDQSSWCSFFDLPSCESAVVEVPGTQTAVFFVVAAFPTDAAPRLSGLTFGVQYPYPAVAVVNYGNCGDFELADAGWPASGNGTSVTFVAPRTEALNAVYWFSAYNYYGLPSGFSLIPHPTQGGNFADDSIPAILDPITNYGSLGFGRPGFAACPGGPIAMGACCFPDQSCQMLPPYECIHDGGVYLGNDVPCDPLPCAAPPPQGACCYPNAVCVLKTLAECEQTFGVYYGDGTVCSPNPCPGNPGACCLPSLVCVRVTPEECAASDGTFLGESISCFPDPCAGAPLGACCFSGGFCLLDSELSCEQNGGIWKGVGSTCEPSACLLSGACCLPGAQCIVITELECVQQEGSEYIGDGTECLPETCVDPCQGLGLSWQHTEAPLPSPLDWPRSGAARPGRANGDGGQNQGGVLILHNNPTLSYTFDEANYCGLSDLASCAEAQTSTITSDLIGIFVLAAFPDADPPRFLGVSFGIDYGACVEMLNWRACSDFESPDPDWPSPGSGTGIAFTLPQTNLLTELYWFVTYVEPNRVEELRLIPHPTQGATFGDDSVPAVLDPVVDLGRFGFNAPGYLPCPGVELGACCLATGECFLLSEGACATQSGEFQGADVPCNPNPCPPPVPILRQTWGATKRLFR